MGNTEDRFTTTPTGLRNDVAVYDPATGWRSAQSQDNVAAFFDTVHGRLVLWGGQYFDRVTNDLWYYSAAENRWTEVSLAPGAPIPPGRVGGVYFVRETPDAYELYIHSGITNEFGDGELLNDLWRLTWPKN